MDCKRILIILINPGNATYSLFFIEGNQAKVFGKLTLVSCEFAKQTLALTLTLTLNLTLTLKLTPTLALTLILTLILTLTSLFFYLCS
jgi:hypothetical protein